jgi:hypothetical protein
MNKRTALGLILSLGAMATASYGQAIVKVRESRACSRLTAIAEDPQKMTYVKMWATARMKDPQFMQEVRRYPWFEGRDPRKKKYIDLDWTYLGFDPDYSRIEFNISVKDVHDADATKVGSITLSQQRTSIVIRLNDRADMALGWTPEEMRELRPVADGVFVDCGSGATR